MADERAAAAQVILQCTDSLYKIACLKCVIDLGIADALHRLGGRATADDLHSALSLPLCRRRHFERLMRASVCASFFSEESDRERGGQPVIYALTPVSRLIIRDGNCEQPSMAPAVSTGLHPLVVATSFSPCFAQWFKDETAPPTPFEMLNGGALWDVMARDAAWNADFNSIMAADSRSLVRALVAEHGRVFEGLTSLVDVGGGVGAASATIAEAFPAIKCTVLDLPHVVSSAPSGGVVKFVAGSMFDHVPPADAVLLKRILHDWNDEDCKKILQRCKEALPAAYGGKVIIIDAVLDSGDRQWRERDLLMDMRMLSLFGGQERDEHEWRTLLAAAGFGDCRFTPIWGSRSVIEAFPSFKRE